MKHLSNTLAAATDLAPVTLIVPIQDMRIIVYQFVLIVVTVCKAVTVR